ncbi:hypothetical protein PF005_g7919 [Phytophthora fragariae]|nr:hypothetical protein PF011_g7070 [Phytophthora fragariae]KAE9219337.1 hypothetical protein PF005_g7919 [Phytophthora fragariae]
MSMRFRVLRTGQTQSQQCQVVVGGDVHAQVSELVSLLRAPTENESNTLLRALYGSHFIYSSLVHAVTSPSSERDSLLSPRSRGSVVAAGQQLMQISSPEAPSSSVTSNSHSSIHRRETRGVKNEQCCYIELFTPTQEGFEMVFCSLDDANVTAGKAPPERVIALHPVSGWLTAEPKRGIPGTLQLTFQESVDWRRCSVDAAATISTYALHLGGCGKHY